MTRSPGSRFEVRREQRSWLRLAGAGTVALFFLVLAYFGGQGQRRASRQARLDDVLFCRDQLQEALDAQRSAASGPRAKRSATDTQPTTPAAREWAAKLKARLTAFRASYVAGTDVEEQDLRLSEATLAVAERRFADALRAIGAPAEPRTPGGSGTRDDTAEVLRVQADARYDMRDWPAALDLYGRLLLLQPDELSAVERLAECLSSLQQVDRALATYADLAERLHDRGSRLLEQLDHRSAVRDLNKAATIRLWLFEQGRREVAADLARSFSRCAAGFVAERSLDRAGDYFAHAIDIQTQLIGIERRIDLAGELAANHAEYAELLLELRKPDEALAQFGSAIDIRSRLVNEGRLEFRRELATNFAHRGLVRQAQGQPALAARDFENAAAMLAELGESDEAAEWRQKALDVAPERPGNGAR